MEIREIDVYIRLVNLFNAKYGYNRVSYQVYKGNKNVNFEFLDEKVSADFIHFLLKGIASRGKTMIDDQMKGRIR